MITDAKIKDIAETYYDKGREEGRAEGRVEGREEGREEGRQERQAEIIQALIDAGFDKERLLAALKQAEKSITPEP